MRAKTKVYYTPRPLRPAEARLCIHMIGFHRQPYRQYIHAPTGSPVHLLVFVYHEVDMLLDGAMTSAPANSLTVIDPNTPVRYGRPDRLWRHSWTRISGTRLSAWLHENQIPIGRPIRFGNRESTDTYLSLLHEELTNKHGPDTDMLEHLFRAWLRRIHRAVRTEHVPVVPVKLVRAKHYIEDRYLRKLTLAELARAAGMSRSHFCAAFHRHFGVAPVDYAIQLRLQHAALLLEDPAVTVTEVALASGYEDMYYFSKLFKKHMGHSPSEFRKRELSLAGGMESV